MIINSPALDRLDLGELKTFEVRQMDGTYILSAKLIEPKWNKTIHDNFLSRVGPLETPLSVPTWRKTVVLGGFGDRPVNMTLMSPVAMNLSERVHFTILYYEVYNIKDF